MLKILLVIPPEESYIEASSHQKVDKKREARPKLGILYVATYLKKHQPDVEVKVLDCPSENINFVQYEEFVREFNPDLVGITALTFTIVDALKTVKHTKEINPRTLVCIGGFHSTLFPQETLKQPGVDFIVVGEGEVTFNELVKELSVNNPEFKKIQGLGFHKGADIIINPQRALVEDLNLLPFPDYHMVDIKKYAHVLGKDAVTVAIQSSRGCPFGCIFCDIRRTKFRFRSADNIVEEITYWYKEGIRSFFFIDDNFVLRRDRLADICAQIKERNMKIDFKISARVDGVDREMLIDLKNAGCSRINFGVESGHQKHLDYLGKGINPVQTERAFRLCREVGIKTFAYMMIGILNETREEMYAELDFLRKIKTDYTNFTVCSPYPKTKLYEKLLEDKVVKHDYWQDFAENPTKNFVMPVVPGQYTVEELRNIQAELTRRYYLSRHIILRELKEIKSFRQFYNMSKLGLKILLSFKSRPHN